MVTQNELSDKGTTRSLTSSHNLDHSYKLHHGIHQRRATILERGIPSQRENTFPGVQTFA